MNFKKINKSNKVSRKYKMNKKGGCYRKTSNIIKLEKIIEKFYKIGKPHCDSLFYILKFYQSIFISFLIKIKYETAIRIRDIKIIKRPFT